MLKLTYTENHFYLERLDRSLEDWVNTRVILALQTDTKMYIESSTASFLVAEKDIPNLANLEQGNQIELCRCDADFLEVSLKGLWLTSDSESEVGVFVTRLDESTEFLLEQMQQSKQSTALTPPGAVCFDF